jgi:hypothetical protein
MTEQIECDGCGRSFVTEDAPGMLAAITGPCPSSGGTFRLARAAGSVAAPDEPAPHASR